MTTVRTGCVFNFSVPLKCLGQAGYVGDICLISKQVRASGLYLWASALGPLSLSWGGGVPRGGAELKLWRVPAPFLVPLQMASMR